MIAMITRDWVTGARRVFLRGQLRQPLPWPMTWLPCLLLVVLVLGLGGCVSEDEEPTSWLAWQTTSIKMMDGDADLFYVELAGGQKLQMLFTLEPSYLELSVVVGTIRNPRSADWSWGYQEEEFSRVRSGDTIVFEAGNTYDYGIWMKPRLDRTVTAYINYRFST